MGLCSRSKFCVSLGTQNERGGSGAATPYAKKKLFLFEPLSLKAKPQRNTTGLYKTVLLLQPVRLINSVRQSRHCQCVVGRLTTTHELLKVSILLRQSRAPASFARLLVSGFAPFPQQPVFGFLLQRRSFRGECVFSHSPTAWLRDIIVRSR